MYLEKRFLLFWITEENWTQTFYSYSGSMVRQIDVSGGTYRVKAVYTAYSGSVSETFTGYSANVVY
ncbi:MAG: hypothetical protein ACYC5K_10790 [Saccharofermentanales bacterium]